MLGSSFLGFCSLWDIFLGLSFCNSTLSFWVLNLLMSGDLPDVSSGPFFAKH